MGFIQKHIKNVLFLVFIFVNTRLIKRLNWYCHPIDQPIVFFACIFSDENMRYVYARLLKSFIPRSQFLLRVLWDSFYIFSQVQKVLRMYVSRHQTSNECVQYMLSIWRYLSYWVLVQCNFRAFESLLILLKPVLHNVDCWYRICFWQLLFKYDKSEIFLLNLITFPDYSLWSTYMQSTRIVFYTDSTNYPFNNFVSTSSV